MKRANILLTVGLAAGLVVGGLSLSLIHNNAVTVKADATPNATYNRIYNDSWNNTTYGSDATCNQILVVYTGTPHGYSTDEITTDPSVLDNILLNGTTLSSYSGALVRAWHGQPFIYIVYPKTSVASGEGCTLEVKQGFTFGDSIFNQFALILGSNGKWVDSSYSNDVNATYNYIWRDDYNNGTHAEGYNRLMVTYTGTAHNHNTPYSGASQLALFDHLVKINGRSISTYAGGSTQIAPFGGQPWIQFIYPADSVSPGSTFVIERGTKFGDAVFERVVFKLNSSNVWRQVFEGEVNATFKAIHTNINSATQMIIVFNGTALPAGKTIANAEQLKNYDNYIVYNGLPISNYTGWQLLSWASSAQPWFYLVFPTASAGDELEIKEGCTFFGAVFERMVFQFNGSKWALFDSGEVNATFQSIPYDAYNNTQNSTGINQLLIQYSGSVAQTGLVYSGMDVTRFDNYIKINGNPISSDANTTVRTWTSAQRWIWIMYSASSVTTGSTLVIERGTKFGEAVFEKMMFQLNASGKWEHLTLIDEDPLVRENDYLLFTPSDYNLAGNDTNPFYGEVGSILSDSFGFRMNITIPSGELANTLLIMKFGTTNIYGSGAIEAVTIDFDNNVYLTFNGSVDYNTSKTITWTEDETHVVEFYTIRTDSTHVVCLFGIDGLLIFKSAEKDISEIDFTGHTFVFIGNSGTTKLKSYYDSCSDTTEKAVNRFARVRLHSEDISVYDYSGTGACAGANGYYSKAKATYNNYLTTNQKLLFTNGAAYADMRERFSTWATFNGETLTFDTTTGEIQVSARVVFRPFEMTVESQSTLIVVIIAVLTAAAGGLFFYIRRKKQD